MTDRGRKVVAVIVSMLMMAMAGCGGASAVDDLVRLVGRSGDDIARALSVDAKLAGGTADDVARTVQPVWASRIDSLRQSYQEVPEEVRDAGCDFVSSLYGQVMVYGPESVTWSKTQEAGLGAVVGLNPTLSAKSFADDVRKAMTEGPEQRPAASSLLLIKIMMCPPF